MQPGTLVFDLQEMGRRPGTERTFERVIDAPADLGNDVLAVPEGSPLQIELRLEAVMEGVLATGTASGGLVGECVRCLRPIDEDFDVDLQELYVYTAADEDDLVIEGDSLDLEPVLRDAVVLAVPLNPLCDPECPGLCPECGERLADDPDHAHGDAIDPRWAKLTLLTDQTESEPSSPDEPEE